MYGLNIRLVNTYHFMSFSLDGCVIIYLKFVFSAGCMSLVNRKGVYPHEYTDLWEKLKQNQLPTKEYFNKSLNYSNIIDEDYELAYNSLKSY